MNRVTLILLGLLGLLAGRGFAYSNLTNDNSGQVWPSGTEFTTVYYVSSGTNLIMQYHFGEASGLIAYDSANTNYFASWGGAGLFWTNGLSDGAVYYSNNWNGYLYLNGNGSVTNVFPVTFATRFKLDSLSYTNPLSLYWSDAGATQYAGFFGYINTNGSVAFGYGDNTSTGATGYRLATTGPGVIKSNEFMNVVGTINSGTNIAIYVDGTNVPVTASGAGGAIKYQTSASYFGGDANLNSFWVFRGTLDEAWVYSGILDTGTIASVWGPITNLTGYAAYTNAVATSPGLVLFWPMDETSGTMIRDISGNGLNGTTRNISTYAQSGPTNGFLALQFVAASTSYVYTADSPLLDLNTNWTISGWFKSSGSYAANRGMVAKYNGVEIANNRSYAMYADGSGNVSGATSPDGTFASAVTATYSSVIGTNWHQWFFVKNGTTSIVIYKDGVPVITNSTSIPGNTFNSSSPFIAGNQFSTNLPADCWDGYGTCIAAWATNLSATAISNQYYQAYH